jgi:hypothetical protein
MSKSEAKMEWVWVALALLLLGAGSALQFASGDLGGVHMAAVAVRWLGVLLLVCGAEA